MSSVLHPAGPEEPRVYWMRRAVVLVVVALVVLVLVWAFKPSGGDVQAVPAETPSPAATPTADDDTPADPTPEPEASTSAGPTASPESTPEPTATPERTPTPKPTPTPTTTPSQDADDDQTAQAEAERKKAEQEKAEQEKAEQEKAEQEKAERERAEREKARREAEPATCDSEQVRVTLVGSGSVRSGEDQELELSVINGMSEACELVLDEETFELRIYSGTDRIWTTDSCAEWVPAETTTLQPEKAHEWSMTWPGLRSDGDCSLVEDALQPGTYVATALFQQADPVQLVMRLR